VSFSATLEQGYQFLNSLIPYMLKEALVDGTNSNRYLLHFKKKKRLKNDALCL
jgi:hypothetical protein